VQPRVRPELGVEGDDGETALAGGDRMTVDARQDLHPVAVLLETTDPRLARCTALPAVVEAKKAPSAARRTRWTGTAAVAGIAVLPAAAVLGMLAMTVLVVTLLVWLL